MTAAIAPKETKASRSHFSEHSLTLGRRTEALELPVLEPVFPYRADDEQRHEADERRPQDGSGQYPVGIEHLPIVARAV